MMNKNMPLFGTNGIRGIFGKDLSFKVFKVSRKMSKEEKGVRKKLESELIKGLKKVSKSIEKGNDKQFERIWNLYILGFKFGRRVKGEWYKPKSLALKLKLNEVV